MVAAIFIIVRQRMVAAKFIVPYNIVAPNLIMLYNMVTARFIVPYNIFAAFL